MAMHKKKGMSKMKPKKLMKGTKGATRMYRKGTTGAKKK